MLLQFFILMPIAAFLIFDDLSFKKQQIEKVCENFELSLIAQLETYVAGFPQDDVIAQFSYKDDLRKNELTETYINTPLLNSLGLSINSLVHSSQGVIKKFSQEIQSKEKAFSAFQSVRHQFFVYGENNFKNKSREIFFIYPKTLLTRVTAKPECQLTIFSKSGSLIISSISKPIFSSEFSNALKADVKTYGLLDKFKNLFVNKKERYTNITSDLSIISAQIIDLANVSTSINNNIAMFISLFLFLILIQVLYLWPEWELELKYSQSIQSTLEQYLNGQFNARPRIFAHNHFSGIEKAIDKMGTFLVQLKNHGASLNKTKLEWNQYSEYIKKSHEKETIVLSLTLPSLRPSINKSIELTNLYNEISDFFVRATEQNSGTLDFTTPNQLQSLWGFTEESEFDAANAVMCALSIKIAIDQINERLKANNLKPIEVGIGIHKAKSQITLLGSGTSQTLSVIGEAADEALYISKIAAQSHHEILITDVLAKLVSNYFVIVQLKDMPWAQRTLYEVRGYIDTQETPVLVKKR